MSKSASQLASTELNVAIRIETPPLDTVKAALKVAFEHASQCEDVPERALLEAWCRRGLEEVRCFERALERRRRARP